MVVATWNLENLFRPDSDEGALVLWRTVRKRVDPAQLGLPLAYAAVASKVFE